MIGHQGDQANHTYDIPDFLNAASADNLWVCSPQLPKPRSRFVDATGSTTD